MAHAEKTKARWKKMSPDDRKRFSENLSAKLTGKSKSDAMRKAASDARKGKPRVWLEPNGRDEYSRRRKTEVSNGIRVPPKGNAGNRDFRHTEKAKAKMSASILETRRRLAEEGRSYHSEESMAIAREKKIAFYTDDVRKQHAQKVRAGHERKREVDPECYVRSWFHDPSDPTRRKRFRPTEPVPEGWLRGKGATGPSKIDLVALYAMIGDGLRDAEIARSLSCDPKTVSYYRKKNQ